MNEQVKKQKPLKKGLLLSTILYVATGFLFAFLLRFVVEPTIVVGGSMLPTFKDGEYLINYRLAYKNDEPDYGDIVIIHLKDDPKNEYLIKRVVGLPGDKIEIIDNEFFLNGERVDEPYVLETMKNTKDMAFTLEEDEIFVLGDNRNNSLDSRMFGPINYKEEVRGKVVLRLFPFDQSFKEEELLLARE